MILVYVDDIILVGNSLPEFQHMKTILDTSFKIKDLGLLKYFIGIEVAHSELGISFFQRKYFLNLLYNSGYIGNKPFSTPSDPSIKLHHDHGKPYDDFQHT